MKLSNETINELIILMQQLMKIKIDDAEINRVTIYGDTINLTTSEKYTNHCIFVKHKNREHNVLTSKWISGQEYKPYLLGRSIYIPQMEELQIFENLFDFMKKHSIGYIKKICDELIIGGNSLYDSCVQLKIKTQID